MYTPYGNSLLPRRSRMYGKMMPQPLAGSDMINGRIIESSLPSDGLRRQLAPLGGCLHSFTQ